MKNKEISLLVNGENAFPEIINCIENAETSIDINMFIWRDDQIGNRMAEVVLSAAERGVKVNISVDRYGCVLEKSEEYKKSFFHKHLTLAEKIKVFGLELFYTKNGVRGKVKDEIAPLYEKITNHPNINVSADKFKADHSKWYIIDGEILFVGGINIEDKENGRDINGNIYGDYMAKLCGAEYVEAFKEKLRTGKNLLEEIFFGVNIKKPARRFEMEELYLGLIREAEAQIHITMSYFSPLKKFTDALVAAYKRGVRVTVLVPQKANFQNASNRRTVRKLLKATNGGISVYLSPKMLHTKLVMNENCISFGSTNITKKAFEQLDELNLFVKTSNEAFCKSVAESVRNDLNDAQRITQSREVKYNRLMAFFESFLV